MIDEEFDFSHFSSFIGDDGKKRKINELEKYLEERRKYCVVKKHLKVGDIVKLKGNEFNIIITHLKYNIAGLGTVDYAGKRADLEQDEKKLYIFNQEDISEKIEKEKTNDGEER